MFGIGKKRQTEPQEEFSQFDSGGFRLPVDDREALNIVEKKRKKRRAAPEEPKAQEEPKKSFLKFSLGRKKQPVQDKPKKVRKAKGPKPQGTGKKKLSKYYRRVLSVGVLLSAVIFGVSFGGRSFLNFLDSSVASNKIPETSQNLNARVDQLKKKYEQFNFDSFRLLIDSENKSKPQTDEEKSMWRDSLVTLFGDRYISLMEEQAQTAAAGRRGGGAVDPRRANSHQSKQDPPDNGKNQGRRRQRRLQNFPGVAFGAVTGQPAGEGADSFHYRDPYGIGLP